MDPRHRYEIWTPDGPMTRGEAAKRYGIPKGTLIRRIWANWPPERWFEPPKKAMSRARPVSERAGRFITPYGRLNLTGLAALLDISYETLRNRLYRLGWSEEDTFNTPPYGIPGKNCILPRDEYRDRRLRELESAYQKRLDREQHRRLKQNQRRRALRLKEHADAEDR